MNFVRQVRITMAQKKKQNAKTATLCNLFAYPESPLLSRKCCFLHQTGSFAYSIDNQVIYRVKFFSHAFLVDNQG